MEGWQGQAVLPIRYLYQENQGKHIAHNLAAREANGSLVVILDSDDALVPGALERLHHHWNRTPVAERGRLAGLFSHSMYPGGKLVGRAFPGGPMDSDYREMYYQDRMVGDKLPCFRRDVLQEFPFPASLTRTYVPEGIVWSAMSRFYRIRFIDEALRISYTGRAVGDARPERRDARSPATGWFCCHR